MEKNTTMSLYIVSGVPLLHGASVFKGCLSFFSFFWLDFESKNGCGAFTWKLSESLKARRLHQQVCFCVLLVFIDSVLAYSEMHCGSPLKTLIHSRRNLLDKNTGMAPVDGK